jgi:hypothetical protein
MRDKRCERRTVAAHTVMQAKAGIHAFLWPREGKTETGMHRHNGKSDRPRRRGTRRLSL